MQHFFLVYGDGKAAPSKKHDTLEDARKEAERLAKQHPGSTFHVLEPICRVATSQPQVEWDAFYMRPVNRSMTEIQPCPQMTASQIDAMARQLEEWKMKNLVAARQQPAMFAPPPPPVQITPEEAMRAAGAVQHRFPHNGDAFIEDFQP